MPTGGCPGFTYIVTGPAGLMTSPEDAADVVKISLSDRKLTVVAADSLAAAGGVWTIVVTASSTADGANVLADLSWTLTLSIIDTLCEPPTSMVATTIANQEYVVGASPLVITWSAFVTVPEPCGA